TVEKNIPTVLVRTATPGGSPTAMSTGSVSRDPEPTAALIAPATTPITSRTMRLRGSTAEHPTALRAAPVGRPCGRAAGACCRTTARGTGMTSSLRHGPLPPHLRRARLHRPDAHPCSAAVGRVPRRRLRRGGPRGVARARRGRAGTVRTIGMSNFLRSDLEDLLEHAEAVPHVNQLLVHAGNTPRELLDFCEAKGIRVQAYSPIAHGAILENPEVNAMAERYGVSVPQLCIRCTLQLGTVSLPKTANPERMRAN